MNKLARLTAVVTLTALALWSRKRKRGSPSQSTPERLVPGSEQEQESSSLTPEQARRVDEYYRQIQAERERRCPPGFRYLKRDRYGCLYEKNPHGFGWREWGSDPDEPYEVRRLD